MDVERKSALYELALHRMDQVSGQKNGHFPYKRVAMYSVGLFLWMCLRGLRNILASGSTMPEELQLENP